MSEYAASLRGQAASRRGSARTRDSIRGSSGIFATPIAAARASEARHGGLERLFGTVAIFATAAALVALAALLLPPALRVGRYEISGAAAMSREEVLSAALVHDKEYFFSIDTQAIRANLLAEPRVASARVERRFPGTLRIEIAERVPVATVLAEMEGSPAAISIDAEGVAFAAADPALLGKFPVISGIRFENLRFGARLPPALLPLLSSVGEMEAKEPALLAAFSEIRIEKPAYGDLELVLYPIHHRIPLRSGASLDARDLRSMLLVLDVLGSNGLAASIEEIDFRTGTIVYRNKEGQSGR
jgi:hypothetical protein